MLLWVYQSAPTSFWPTGNISVLLEVNETSTVLLLIWVNSGVWKLCCLWCVQHITDIEFHWYSPGRGTLHPHSIYSLTPAIDCRASLYPLLVKAREKVKSGGADEISIPSLHRSSLSLYISLLLLISLSAPLSSTRVHFFFFLPFQVCSCGFSKTKCSSSSLTGASAGKPQVFETKRLQHPASTSHGNRSEGLHLFARPVLVINRAGGGWTMCSLYCGFRSGLLNF